MSLVAHLSALPVGGKFHLPESYVRELDCITTVKSRMANTAGTACRRAGIRGRTTTSAKVDWHAGWIVVSATVERLA